MVSKGYETGSELGVKVRAAHLRWKLQAGLSLWGLKYQPGRDLIADVGTKALLIARVKEMRDRRQMASRGG